MAGQDKKKSISTKKGDRGETSLFDGTRVSKASLRPEVYGTLDEASAFLGLARAKSGDPEIQAILVELQTQIYLVNAELACPPEAKDRLNHRFEKEHFDALEARAREIEKTLDLPPRFVLYGETEAGAALDVARAVVRRAERALTLLHEAEPEDNPLVKPFVNRLSDMLYLLARREEKKAGRPWRHPEA